MVQKLEKSIMGVGQQQALNPPVTARKSDISAVKPAARKIDSSAAKPAARKIDSSAVKPAPRTPPPAKASVAGGLKLPTAPYPPDFPHHGGPKNAKKSSTHSGKTLPMAAAACGASTPHAASSGAMTNDSTGGAANRTTIGTDLADLMDSEAETFFVGGGRNTKEAVTSSSPPVVIRNNRKIEHMFGVRDESLILESKKKAVLKKGKESRNAHIAKKRGES
jgi:hypothetical protein